MCESVLTASKYVNLSMLSIFKDVTPAEVQAGFLSGCDSLPYLSLMTHPSQTDWYLYKNFGIWWEFLFSVTFCRCLEPAGGRAAAVAGRGGRRAGRTGGEEAQPQGASGCLRVPQRPGGSRPSSPHARGRCGGRPPEGGSRQGAAPPEALLGGSLPAAPWAAPRREAQGWGFKHKHHDRCLSRWLVVEISSCR